MSESSPENDRQDPAEQYQTDTEVETSQQPDDESVEAGGELTGEDSGDEEPAPAAPVEVSPEDPGSPAVTVAPDVPEGAVMRGGRWYTQDADGRHRLVKDGRDY